jgi:hypothetical protein
MILQKQFLFVEWGRKEGRRRLVSLAGTLTFDRMSMCGTPFFPPKKRIQGS